MITDKLRLTKLVKRIPGLRSAAKASSDEFKTMKDVNRKRLLVSEVFSVAGDGTSATAGAGVGFLVGGPPGAVLGAVVGGASSRLVQKLGQEFNERMLSPREDLRLGNVLALADAFIQEKLEQGETLRDDGFFDSDKSGHSDAEEVGEHVLLKSQKEPEEKKLPYMARLLANIAFDESISAQLAHQIIKSAEQLTYRQLCLLCLAVWVEDTDRFELRATAYRGGVMPDEPDIELVQVLHECHGLHNMAYVNYGSTVMFGPANVEPASMTIQSNGIHTYNLMQLWSIPIEDISSLADVLS